MPFWRMAEDSGGAVCEMGERVRSAQQRHNPAATLLDFVEDNSERMLSMLGGRLCWM